MACSVCDSPTITFSIPKQYREYAPAQSSAATCCTRCLAVEPADDEVLEEPDFTRVSNAFPTGETAIPLALALGRCSSLATNRAAIEELLETVERAETDPLLVLDRLVDDPELEPAIDLERRRHQLEQLLY